MTDERSQLTLVVTSDVELPASQHVWGTGGWLPPEDREALDWLTLARLLGWGVAVLRKNDPAFTDDLSTAGDRIVVAGDPGALDDQTVQQLATRLSEKPGLVVAQASASDGPWARLSGAVRGATGSSGRSLCWMGPGSAKSWSCRNEVNCSILDWKDDNSIWATLDSTPVVVARRVNRGVIATIAFHPSAACDQAGAATALLTRLLVWGTDIATAWLDWAGTLILRMDDPGTAESIHHRIYSHPRLEHDEWARLGSSLERRRARLSIGYVSGWVDDGNQLRGVLTVGGRTPERVPGRVHPSPLVQYKAGTEEGRTVLHDYTSEFRGIQVLRRAAVAEVELHGHTHIHPDSESWAAAADRYESVSWYRELGRPASAVIAGRPADQHPLALGIAALRRFFNSTPTTLICPGEQWTNAVLQRALELDLQLVGSYYLALRDGDRFCWSQRVCAPYLDQPDAAWFDGGLPVVGYFHDFDIVRNGVEWFDRYLNEWQSQGATRFIDYRELSAALSRRLTVEERNGELHLHVTTMGRLDLVRPLKILVRPSQAMPFKFTASVNERQASLLVKGATDGVAEVELAES